MLDWPPRQGAHGEAGALGMAVPPARAGEGKAPQDGCVGREQDDLPLTRPVRKRSACDRGVREGGRVRDQLPGRTLAAHRLFFQRQRTLARPSWRPVWAAHTAASA